MHELSLALNILDIVAEAAAPFRGARVLAVHVRLGPLAGVVREALVPAFEIAREGTRFQQAQLVIAEVPLVVRCGTCAADRPAIALTDLRCADCGAPAARVVHGHEFEVLRLEIEE